MRALQFSGGKDSLVCLYLLEPEWKDLVVIWVNSGAAYPDTLERMREWKRRLPHFLEVRSNQPSQIRKNGFPVDNYKGKPGTQHYYQCCSENLWQPMWDAIEKLGVDAIIRGTRRSDPEKSLIEPGQVVDGIRYEFPIWEWSDSEVFDYLTEKGDIPSHYDYEKTGRDCWDCTAYLKDNVERIQRLPKPMKHEILRRLIYAEQIPV